MTLWSNLEIQSKEFHGTLMFITPPNSPPQGFIVTVAVHLGPPEKGEAEMKALVTSAPGSANSLFSPQHI